MSAAGRTTQVASTAPKNVTYASAITYWEDGSLNVLPVGNNVTETTTRDNKFQATSIAASANSVPLLALGYAYGLNGNVTCQAIGIGAVTFNPGPPCQMTGGSWSAAQAYAYDGVNRLQSAAENSANLEQYGYNAEGNRWELLPESMLPALRLQSSDSTPPQSFTVTTLLVTGIDNG